MKVLLLNQCFHPDVASSGQHLTDLAVELAVRGHRVTVVASRRGYDDPTVRFAKRETWKGISIIRIPSLGLGKQSKWRRALDFASYWLSCLSRLFVLPRFDVVVALTSPPLISFLGALFARLKGTRFVYWVMDLNPDQAIAAGWLHERSPLCKLLDIMLRYSLRRADCVVALDRFMKARIAAKGVPAANIVVIPPWSHDEEIGYDEHGRQRFRARHRLNDKFVIMYSGNHSPCHPLDTLLEAAERLACHPQIVFCFVGGGKEFRKVQNFASQRRMKNIVCLPYQPLDQLSESLSAADLHVVVLGDPFVGIVHPCKIYNILRIGFPFLAIGPASSHLTDLLAQSNLGEGGIAVRHGDVQQIVEYIEDSAAAKEWRSVRRPGRIADCYSKAVLLPRMIDILVPDGERSADGIEKVGEREEAIGAGMARMRSKRTVPAKGSSSVS
jgi:glycosyltransferase involved in cell wall biosynthesis